MPAIRFTGFRIDPEFNQMTLVADLDGFTVTDLSDIQITEVLVNTSNGQNANTGQQPVTALPAALLSPTHFQSLLRNTTGYVASNGSAGDLTGWGLLGNLSTASSSQSGDANDKKGMYTQLNADFDPSGAQWSAGHLMREGKLALGVSFILSAGGPWEGRAFVGLAQGDGVLDADDPAVPYVGIQWSSSRGKTGAGDDNWQFVSRPDAAGTQTIIDTGIVQQANTNYTVTVEPVAGSDDAVLTLYEGFYPGNKLWSSGAQSNVPAAGTGGLSVLTGVKRTSSPSGAVGIGTYSAVAEYRGQELG